MKYKSDWPDARRRLTALWQRELLDRPCLAVRAPSGRSVEDLPQPADNADFWLDPVFRAALARRQLETTWWGGEAVPSVLKMAGWVICLGGTPCFSRDTIWFETRSVDFKQPTPFRHDPDSQWPRKYTAYLLALCRAAGHDDFLVGAPGGLPANDLLSMHMGTQDFLLALMDHPDWMADAILTGARDQRRAQNDFQDLMRAQGHVYWYGNSGWMPFWAPQPFASTQSDVSCMLSPEMFDSFVLPELELIGAEHGALWYHLDGGDAKQHLPRLLSLPFLRVVQYVPAPCEPPNGPGHLEMYRLIQAAGKIVHIDVPHETVQPLLRELDPSLLLLQTECNSIDEGEALLKMAQSTL